MPRLRVTTVLALALLLIAPVGALYRASAWLEGWLLIGIPSAVNLLTFLAYRSDKRRAESGQWRIPESTLHLAELLGGWPGAFLAQRLFRHKTAKVSFQWVFWGIVLVHQCVAVDYLRGWRWATQVWH